MEKQNVHLKIIVEVCLVFCLLAFALLLLRSNFTYANSNQVYYLEDLKEGDYLPYGSVILTTEDYHGYSGAFYDYDGVHYSEGYINYARVSYYQDEFCFFNYSYLSCKGKYAGDYIDIHSSYSIKEFSSLFEEEDSYVGWVVKEVYGSTVSLLPVSDYSKINRTPALDNSYTIDTYFVNTESGLVANSWYLIRDIDAYEIEGEDFWTKEENVFHFRNTGTYPVGETYTLSFTFSAEAGNIVTFDTRSWLGYSIPTGKILDTFGVQFNGADLSLPTGRDCRYNHCYQSADLYETVYLPVEESGEQTLTFTYTVTGDAVQKTNNGTYTYGYVRGVSVLSYLNEGKQLDTSLVKEGDKLYYMSIGDEQYVLGERLVYTAISATEETEEKPDVVENPITMDAIFLFCLVVFMILLFFRYITAKMKFMR